MDSSIQNIFGAALILGNLFSINAHGAVDHYDRAAKAFSKANSVKASEIPTVSTSIEGYCLYEEEPSGLAPAKITLKTHENLVLGPIVSVYLMPIEKTFPPSWERNFYLSEEDGELKHSTDTKTLPVTATLRKTSSDTQKAWLLQYNDWSRVESDKSYFRVCVFQDPRK